MQSLFVFLLLLVPLVLAQTAPISIAALHNIAQRAHESGTFDGVIVISQSGKIRYAEAFGLADKAHNLKMQTDTLFRLASETKQVTALLIMQEVTNGRLSLTQSAGEIMPGLAPSTGRVTIKQLLQHVSGLPNPSDGPDNVVPPFYLRTGPEAANNTKSALGFCSGPPKRDGGAQFEYNNCDYLVLGALLEKATRKSYATLVRERITIPLDLRSWGVFSSDPSQAPRVALGYGADGKVELPQNVATYGAAGAIYGNALDLAKWDDALLSFKLLPQDATNVMFTADPKLYGEALGSWSYDTKGTDGPVRVIERQGEIGGTRLLNNLLPGLATSVVIIANTERADLSTHTAAKVSATSCSRRPPPCRLASPYTCASEPYWTRR